MDVFEDKQSDDIYIYDSNTERNERISCSHFGQPVNFLPETGFPCPAIVSFISANGRYVLLLILTIQVGWHSVFLIIRSWTTMDLGCFSC